MNRSAHNLPMGRTTPGLSPDRYDGLRILLTAAEEELRDLDVRRAHVLEQITRYKNMLSSPQWWPPELIRKIMLLAVRESGKDPLTKDDPRLSISQICARWREIAFDIVEIWDIKVDVSGRGSCSKRISLMDCAIIPNSHHLRKLHLTADCQNLQAILTLPSGSFTALEGLEIRSHCGDDPFFPRHGGVVSDLACQDISTIDAATAFTFAPCLRTVTAGIYTRDQRKLQFPWSQLTELDLFTTPIAPNVCLLILSKCTSLVRCGLSFIRKIDNVAAPLVSALSQTPVHLPMLKKLYLFLEEFPGVAQFLNSLVLPNLCGLTLLGGFCQWSNPERAADYISFFTNFSSTLQVLSLGAGDRELPTEHLGWTLKCVPHVKRLFLSYECQLQPSIMQMIARGALLPHVEEIQFETDDTFAVIDMLKTRQSKARFPPFGKPTLSSLKKVTINGLNRRHQLTGNAMEVIGELRSRGLEVTFK